MRVVFLYLAQLHQIPHTLPIAMEMAKAGAAVHLASAGDGHLAYLRELAGYWPDVSPTFDRLYLPGPLRAWVAKRGDTTPPKVPALLLNLPYFRSFDAVVVPERTSLLLKKLGLGKTQLVWTGHGGGDRAHGYTDNVRRFDFVLLPGEKLVRRHREAGNIREGHYGVGGYAKFDLVAAMREAGRPPLFANDRPTVVYNPHFRPNLSSWPEMGMRVLDWFAEQGDYNLVFAPHVRLFDPPTPAKYEAFRRFRDLAHMRIDLGSTASIDMTYTGAADIYLGDVSSQIGEYMSRPRPIVFLNPRRTPWVGDPNYRSWELGPVVEDLADLGPALQRARATENEMRQRQAAYFADTFDVEAGVPSAPRGAKAILDYLRRERSA